MDELLRVEPDDFVFSIRLGEQSSVQCTFTNVHDGPISYKKAKETLPDDLSACRDRLQIIVAKLDSPELQKMDVETLWETLSPSDDNVVDKKYNCKLQLYQPPTELDPDGATLPPPPPFPTTPRVSDAAPPSDTAAAFPQAPELPQPPSLLNAAPPLPSRPSPRVRTLPPALPIGAPDMGFDPSGVMSPIGLDSYPEAPSLGPAPTLLRIAPTRPLPPVPPLDAPPAAPAPPAPPAPPTRLGPAPPAPVIASEARAAKSFVPTDADNGTVGSAVANGATLAGAAESRQADALRKIEEKRRQAEALERAAAAREAEVRRLAERCKAEEQARAEELRREEELQKAEQRRKAEKLRRAQAEQEAAEKRRAEERRQAEARRRAEAEAKAQEAERAEKERQTRAEEAEAARKRMEAARDRVINAALAPQIVLLELTPEQRQRAAVDRCFALCKSINERQEMINELSMQLVEAKHKLSNARVAVRPAYNVVYEVDPDGRIPLPHVALMAIVSLALLTLFV